MIDVPSGADIQPSQVADSSPFKFLDYFREIDSVRFAGREQDIEEVVARIAADRTFVLYSRSGLGKTSLLLAGVFKPLKERGYTPIHVRLLDNPADDLRSAIVASLPATTASGTAALEDLLRAVASQSGVILVFDQFEEFFIRQRDRADVRRDFIRSVIGLLDGPLPIRLVFSLREDFLAEMDDLSQFHPDILGNMYRLRPLTAFGARQAIIAPLRAAGIKYSEQLLRGLVELVAETGFDPLMLQIACNEVYLEALKDHRKAELKESDLGNIGGIKGLFTRYLSHALKQVGSGRLIPTRAILDSLITSEQTKRAMTLKQLQDNPDVRSSEEETQDVLKALERQRLVRRESRQGDVWFELAHDRLVEPILDWFKTDPKFVDFRTARDFVTQGARDDFRTKLERLLSRPQFEHVHQFRDRMRLDERHREFMFWSAVVSAAEPSELTYWADAWSTEACAGVLKGLLEHRSKEVRAGAAKAVAALADRCAGLSAVCVDLAMEDPDATVRSAAGQALARIATAGDRDKVRQRFWRRRSSVRAVEVMADFADAGQSLASFGPVPRILAWKKARTRKIDSRRDDVRFRTRRGGITGLLSGLAIGATTGSVVVCAMLWASVEITWSHQYWDAILVVAIASLVVGAIFGSRFARSAARDAVCAAEGRWFRAILRVWSPVVLLLLLFGVGALLTTGGFPFGVLATVAAAAWGTLVVVGACIAAVRIAVWPLPGRWPVVGLGLLLAVIPPAAAVLILRAVTGRAVMDAGSDLDTSIVFAAAVVGLLSGVAFVTLADGIRARPLAPLVPVRPRVRRTMRFALVALTLGTVASVLMIVDRARIPFLAADVRPGVPFDLPVREHPMYLNLAGLGERASWLLVSNLPANADVRATSNSGESAELHGTLLYVSPRRQLLVARGPSATADSQPRLDPLAILAKGAALKPAPDRWTPILVRFTRVPSSGGPELRHIWRGRFEGVISPDVELVGTLAVRFPEHAHSATGSYHMTLSEVARTSQGRAVYLPRPPATLRYERAVARARDARGGEEPIAGLDLGVSILPDRKFGATLQLEMEAGSSDPFSRPVGWTPPPDELDVPLLISLNTAAAAAYERATGHFATKRFDRAQIELEQALRADPENLTYRNDLAWSLVALTLTTKVPLDPRALEFSREAAGKATNNPFFLDTLAHAEYLSEHWVEAAAAWEKVFSLDPDYPASDPLCARDFDLLADARQRSSSLKSKR